MRPDRGIVVDSERTRGANPAGGLGVERVIGVGCSEQFVDRATPATDGDAESINRSTEHTGRRDFVSQVVSRQTIANSSRSGAHLLDCSILGAAVRSPEVVQRGVDLSGFPLVAAFVQR
ncbi:hypothetical protein GCM10025792_41490 [Pseudonocardia tropica]